MVMNGSDNNVNNSVSHHHHHVAVMAFPFATHAAPLLTLVRRLASAAVTTKTLVRFSFFSTDKSNGVLFNEKIVIDDDDDDDDTVKPYNVWDGVPDGHKMSGNPTEPIGLFLRSAAGSFKKAMDLAVAESGLAFTCFITDAFFWFLGEMAEEMHVPWVPFWTAGPCSLTAHVNTDLLRQKFGENGVLIAGGMAGHGDESLSFIPGLEALTFNDLPEGVVSGDLESPMARMLHNMGRMLPRAAAVPINSFEDIDPTLTSDLKSNLKNFLNVGLFTLISPHTIPDHNGCLTWLDTQKTSSVAYISFGSVIVPSPQELAALAEGLELSGVPFLWSFRGNPNEHLPKGFTERTSKIGKIVPWAPQLQVLQHRSTAMFVTHCGWNSITESITAGVPMICRPFFGDQKLNMRVVQNVWGIGVGVEKGMFTKDDTVTYLGLILSEEGKTMRHKLEALKERAMESVASSNGSSVKNLCTLLDVVTRRHV